MERRTLRFRSSAAFTLLELLVSLAVLSLLVVMLTSLFTQVSKAWNQSEGQMEQRRSLRAIADFISSDMRAAALPLQPPPTGRTEGGAQVSNVSGNLQFIVNPSATFLSKKYRNADAAFWQAPIATDADGGDFAIVGYFVRWVDERKGTILEAEADLSTYERPRPVLCRLFINPPTDTSGSGAMEDYKIYDSDKDAWLKALEGGGDGVGGRLLDRLAAGTRGEQFSGLFAENVIGFWIQCFDFNDREFEPNNSLMGGAKFDSRYGYAFDFKYKSMAGPEVSAEEERYLPAYAIISLAQVDSKYAERITGAANQLRDMVSDNDIRSANTFVEELNKELDRDPTGTAALRAIVPGLRTYSTTVYFDNSRVFEIRTSTTNP